MQNLNDSEPRDVFYYFEQISKIPRETYNMKEVSDYCVEFARDHGLEYTQDSLYNVIIKKEGCFGYEKSLPVILQGHMDMVCEKKSGSNHDFKTDPLELYVENGFVKAKDTSLGADNGIAVAYMLALLHSNNIPHPPLEILLTVNEEVSMDGAENIDLSDLKGKMLINIDSEQEGVLVVGCAGGFRGIIKIPIQHEEKTGTALTICVSGLNGGHSGVEIAKQRDNANKVLGRLLTSLFKQYEVYLVKINGGTKDNVISTSASATILVKYDCIFNVIDHIRYMEKIMKDEFGGSEENFNISSKIIDESKIYNITKCSAQKVLMFLNSIPQGVQCFSRNLERLVETSLNLGVIKTEKDFVAFTFLVRSELESKKNQIKDLFFQWAKFLEGSCEINGEYPSWAYRKRSKLRNIMIDSYKNLFGRIPEVETIHAGLECGLLTEKKRDLDCVSFGPQMYDIHSFNEKLNISSAQRMWKYLQDVLSRCK